MMTTAARGGANGAFLPRGDDTRYTRPVFDPATIADEACTEGHLDADPIYGVLLSLGQKQITGRLTVADAAGDNHMYFMQGRPVGVHLAEHFHPLGQLLLELGRCSGATFVRAQRLIAEGNRLPGQVYKELRVLDDAGLKDVLAIQARRKAEHFCRLGSRAFTFCRGLTFLTGFTSTPLDPHAVIFLAVRQQMGEQSRENWLEAARDLQVRLVPPGGVPAEGATVEHLGLPAPPLNYGFGAPEERFLQRLLMGFESVVDLAETGTLPRDEMAVLLRYLEVIGRLQRRPIPPKRVPTPAPAPPLHDATPVEAPAIVHTPTPAPAMPAPALSAPAFSAAPPRSPAGVSPHAVTAPRQVSAITTTSPELEALKHIPLAEPTSEDVFSRPTMPLASAVAPPRPVAPPVQASPTALTDPRRPAPSRESLASPPPAAPADEPAMVFASALEAPPPPPSTPIEDPVPVVKKKKVKRSEPLPSEGSGLLVSETRREKTMVTELPSIVIEDD